MNLFLKFLLVSFGGVIGACFRYGISLLPHFKAHNYLATLLVNALGCLLMGFISVKIANMPDVQNFKAFFIVGFLGSLTTFSTFVFDSMNMFDAASYLFGLSYIFGSLCLGILCFILGRFIT